MRWFIIRVIVFSWTTVSSAFSQCLEGFEQHEEICYKVEALEASWMEAKQYCRTLGSELLIIETEEEETRIEGILTTLHGSRIDETYWISGSDMISENVWRWFKEDGINYVMTYTDWASGRPDNTGGNENCLFIHYQGGRTAWNDAKCYQKHSFICESVVKEVPIVEE